MPDLSTKYLGLPLKNPVIVSSSPITGTIQGIKLCEQSGAAAVVLKSLFEEQIREELNSAMGDSQFDHPEAYDYIQRTGMQFGQDEYLNLIKAAKKSCKIPIIASLNCINSDWWETYAKRIQNAGADALELNIAIMPRSFVDRADHIERRYLNIIEKITSIVSLPISTKIGPYFTSLPLFSTELRRAGVSALVLFNRFYHPDFDIETMKIKAAYRYSSPEELVLPLRWISILYNNTGCDLTASTGVHTSEDVIKLILAGASASYICSVVHKEGMKVIGKIVDGIGDWMEKKRYKSLDEFRGKMSQSASDDPEMHERVQYIKAMTRMRAD
jgi:dihydroorotate dehydrogenase (fumarate)